MNRISTSTRIALLLVMLSLNSMLVASLLKLFPDERAIRLEGRVGLCESLAVGCSRMATRNDFRGIEQLMNSLVMRNPEVVWAVLKDGDGTVLVTAGHVPGDSQASSADKVAVPIATELQTWGYVEVQFRPIGNASPLWLGITLSPFTEFMVFVAACNGLAFILWLRRMLVHLDPSRVVPTRVRAALDTLAEGLLVLDQSGRIAFVNRSFASTVGQSFADLQGRKATQLEFTPADDQATPWSTLVFGDQPRSGVAVNLRMPDGQQRIFKMNSSPIVDDRGARRGVLVSFDDVTVMEKKKTELMEMLDELTRSRNKIRKQNEQLQELATRDALTGCFNRRSFFETFEKCWELAHREHRPLSCIMVDVDHFKSVNDTHGHATGDEVLKAVAETLRKEVGDVGTVGRYGGEEFCILLPGLAIDVAADYAETYRRAIAALKFHSFSVTASLGVSCTSGDAASPQELMDQADKCLYVAKRGGRNQVVRWDCVSHDVCESSPERSEELPAEAKVQPTQSVPYHAVSALLSALAYRDPDTAAHSTRVADLCVATARGLMSVAEIYILETAALLHDIGKIGVPDSILLKPSGLTSEEFRIMRMHDRIGVEIVAASFDCGPLVDIVRFHHSLYSGDSSAPHMPHGEAIPLGARIVSIADAYDAMVSDRVYRKGRSRKEAFEELRRWAGVQFDPVLVERFIEVVSTRRDVEAPRDPRFSKELALHIGVQTEHLVRAVNDHDLSGIAALARRLEATASKYGTSEISRIARELHLLSSDATDLDQVIQLAHDLVDLCTYAQKAYATVEGDLADAALARRQAVAMAEA